MKYKVIVYNGDYSPSNPYEGGSEEIAIAVAAAYIAQGKKVRIVETEEKPTSLAPTGTTAITSADTADLIDILTGYLGALETMDNKLLDNGRNDMRFPAAMRKVKAWISRLKGDKA